LHKNNNILTPTGNMGRDYSVKTDYHQFGRLLYLALLCLVGVTKSR